MRLIRSCVFLLILVLFCSRLQAEEPSEIKAVKPNMMEVSAFYQVLNFYQKTLSKINGSDCVMIPSCSRYAQDSFKKHGFLGLFHTADRLVRCSRDTWQYHSVINKEGREKYVDKVFP
ncbi:MAG TPA: membrane protein insertion efficiency factor YidD [Candidatus Cloacimonadota bacterium]|nr:membrane protein insertion efficiency factor YidD [Candidatus Cloacimonadota bacterium]